MRMIKTKSLLLLFIVNVTSPCFASWPVFAAPDLRILQNENLLETANCPTGKAKVIENASINIKNQLCRNFCDPEWSWSYVSDNQCHELATDFQLWDISIQHITNADKTSYSVVTASYGQNGDAFKFIMKTEQDNYWYCSVLNLELGLVTCANDQ